MLIKSYSVLLLRVSRLLSSKGEVKGRFKLINNSNISALSLLGYKLVFRFNANSNLAS